MSWFFSIFNFSFVPIEIWSLVDVCCEEIVFETSWVESTGEVEIEASAETFWEVTCISKKALILGEILAAFYSYVFWNILIMKDDGERKDRKIPFTNNKIDF